MDYYEIHNCTFLPIFCSLVLCLLPTVLAMCSVCDLFAAALQFNYKPHSDGGTVRQRGAGQGERDRTREDWTWCAKIIISMRRRFRGLICKFPVASFVMRKSSTKKKRGKQNKMQKIIKRRIWVRHVATLGWLVN